MDSKGLDTQRIAAVLVAFAGLSLGVAYLIFRPEPDPKPERCPASFVRFDGDCVDEDHISFLKCLEDRGKDVERTTQTDEGVGAKLKLADFQIDIGGKNIGLEALKTVAIPSSDMAIIQACHKLLPDDGPPNPQAEERARTKALKDEVVRTYADFVIRSVDTDGEDWSPNALDNEVNETARRLAQQMETLDDDLLTVAYRAYKYHYVGLAYFMVASTTTPENHRERVRLAKHAVKSFAKAFEVLGADAFGVNNGAGTDHRKAYRWAADDGILDRNNAYFAFSELLVARALDRQQQAFDPELLRARQHYERVSSGLKSKYKTDEFESVRWMKAQENE